MTELPERDLPPGRHRLLKEHLMTETLGFEDSPRARRAWLRPVLVAGAVAAVSAVTFTLVAPSGGSGPGAPRSVGAGALLESAATAAEREGDGFGDARDDQYRYVDKEVSNTGTEAAVNGKGAEGVQSPHRVEEWDAVDGARPGLIRTAGREESIAPSTQAAGKSDYEYVKLWDPASLPTGADGMYAWLTKSTSLLRHGRVLVEPTPFMRASELIGSGLLPPKQSAALYRAVARIPGVTVVRHAVDAAGRPGVALAHQEPGLSGREEWIFDQETYRFLGTRFVYTEDRGEHKKGSIGDATVVLRRAVVSRAGQRP
ncbi:CU044_5270 family protein [Streptomyces sp. NPDC059582]|uniref:CU044_5270 family protein n=1 Tax=Streptomyces sp. NPDC059582 TaxID=3346875 RepID=UPI0036B83A60